MATRRRRAPQYTIVVVVDRAPRSWPSAASLIEVGVTAEVAVRYVQVRREFTLAGLKRKLGEVRN